MPTIARILLSGSIGAIVCAILSFLTFFLLTVFDNQKLIEIIAYGLIVGMIGAFIGVIIGLAVGIGDLGVIGGGVAGFLGTLHWSGDLCLLYRRKLQSIRIFLEGIGNIFYPFLFTDNSDRCHHRIAQKKDL